MKKTIFIIFAMFTMTFANAQNNASTFASNQTYSIEYWQFTNYSDYAGYVMWIENFTDEPIDVTIELTSLGIVRTYHVEPHSIWGGSVNIEVAYQLQYISKMWIKSTAYTSHGVSKLKVRTP